MIRSRITTVFLATLLMLGLLAPAALAQQPNPGALLQNVQVTGQALNQAGDVVGDFAGTLDVTQITRQGDQLALEGLLTGDVTDAAGDVIGSIGEVIGGILDPGQQECPILNLQLGPLDLDLLGLVIELDQVNLDITAVPGPGRLLGNLLCAVVGLLDGPGPLQGVANAVDRLLDRINNLL